ncbi:MAG: serine/threonine-protein kinase [Myxococcota bacterium]
MRQLKQLMAVGLGARSVVYRGLMVGAQGFDKPVAIKRLRPEWMADPVAIDLFVNEARIAVQLNHPNVVSGLELGEDEGGYFLLCEWLDCVTLAELRLKHGGLSLEQCVWIGVQLCDALTHVHTLKDNQGVSLGIVHRDVTPSNVLFTHDGQIKLGDFGVAYCHQGRKVVLEQVGTPGFAAPEQQEEAGFDARSDIYGLGATLRSAYDGADEGVCNEKSAALVEILALATAACPQERYRTAQEFKDALEALHIETRNVRQQIVQAVATFVGGAPPHASKNLDGALHSLIGGAFAEPEEPKAGANHAVQAVPQRFGLRRRGYVAAALGLVAVLFLWGVTKRRFPTNNTFPQTPKAVVKSRPQAVDNNQGTANIEATDPMSKRSSLGTTSVAQNEDAETVPPSSNERSHVQDVRQEVRKAPLLGRVSINAVPWANVLIDGRKAGNTPLRPLPRRVGFHQMTLLRPDADESVVFKFRVEAGQQTFVVDMHRRSLRRLSEATHVE